MSRPLGTSTQSRPWASKEWAMSAMQMSSSDIWEIASCS